METRSVSLYVVTSLWKASACITAWEWQRGLVPLHRGGNPCRVSNKVIWQEQQQAHEGKIQVFI